jgi:microcystin-dependent protein
MATVTIVRTSNASQLNSLLSQSSASTIYLAQVSASTTYLTQTSASTTYLTQTSASSAYADKSLEATVAGLSVTPTGAIIMYGASAAPTGWLLCNGQSTSGYPALAAIVGATVPDLRGRAPIGYGQGSGLTNRTTIGANTGFETHTLIESEMPLHNHSGQIVFGTGSGGSSAVTITGNNPTAQPPTGSTGGNGAHNNMQPSTVVNFIIKT